MTQYFVVLLDRSPRWAMGVGLTEEAALAEAQAECGRACIDFNADEHVIEECTGAFFRDMEAAFSRLRSGLVCTKAERNSEDEAAEEAAATAKDRIDEIMANVVIPESCTWGDTRVAMIRVMAEALVAGNKNVVLGKAKQTPMWAAGVPYVFRGPSDHTWPLSEREDHAAREIAENLGIASFLQAFEELRQMRYAKNLTKLKELGKAIYGDEWISPLSRELDVALCTVQRWAAGDVGVPAWVTAKLPALALAKVNEGVADQLDLRAKIIRDYAEAV